MGEALRGSRRQRKVREILSNAEFPNFTPGTGTKKPSDIKHRGYLTLDRHSLCCRLSIVLWGAGIFDKCSRQAKFNYAVIPVMFLF